MLKSHIATLGTGFDQLFVRNPAVDFLRFFSVTVVILAHCGYLTNVKNVVIGGDIYNLLVRNGYLGVVIFFTISGYLICGGLMKYTTDMLRVFYQHRLSKIFPPLFLLVAINVLLGMFFPEFSTRDFSLARVVYDIATFKFNLLYLDGASALLCYAVLWSLSIEEMFYLFFPHVLTKLRKYIYEILLAFVFFGFITRLVVGRDSLYLYFGCFDSIAMGALASLLKARWNQGGRCAARYFAGLLMSGNKQWMDRLNVIFNTLVIILSFVFLSGLYIAFHIEKNYIWLPTAVSGMTMLFLLSSDICNKPVLRSIVYCSGIGVVGALSYELYLFHLPLAMLLYRNNFLSSLPCDVAFMVWMVILAVFSLYVYSFYSIATHRLINELNPRVL